MKKLGIIGGTSWTSTALYYDHINRGVAQRLGGLHSAVLAIESLDLAALVAMQQSGNWAGVARVAADAGKRLAGSGAEVEAIVLGCTELGLLIDARANVLPVYDTTVLHARRAVQWMLGDEKQARAAA